jgi:hypothetical protein
MKIEMVHVDFKIPKRIHLMLKEFSEANQVSMTKLVLLALRKTFEIS